jgi:hypothetical protein
MFKVRNVFVSCKYLVVSGQAHPAEIRCLNEIIGALAVPPCNCHKCKDMATDSPITSSPGAESQDPQSPHPSSLALAMIPQPSSSPARGDDFMDEYDAIVKHARAIAEATFANKSNK